MTLKINGYEVIPGKLWFMRNGKKALIGAVHPDELATTKVIGWVDTVRSILAWYSCGQNFSIYSFARNNDCDLIRPVAETKKMKVPEFWLVFEKDAMDDPNQYLLYRNAEEDAKKLKNPIIVHCPARTIEVEIPAEAAAPKAQPEAGMREFWLVFHYKSDSVPNIFYDKKEAENSCLSAQKAGHPRAFVRHCWTKEVEQ